MIIQITEPKEYSKKALARYASLGSVVKRATPVKNAEVLVIGLAHRIDKAWMERMPKLKIIASPATGLNHMDMEEAKKRGITIISLKGQTSFLKNIPSTAEKTFGLILAVVRNIPWAFDDVKSGKWDRHAWRGHQLVGKTLGLIGFGRLGTIVARYGRAFGMKVVAFDPYVGSDVMARAKVQKVSLEALLKESDIVSLHVPLEKETEGLLREGHFKRMKRGAYFINTARGELIDERALLTALKKKWIQGAALDVVWNERGDGSHLKNNPLIEYAKTNTNLVIVPHIGGATFEAMEITQEFIADLVAKKYKHA